MAAWGAMPAPWHQHEDRHLVLCWVTQSATPCQGVNRSTRPHWQQRMGHTSQLTLIDVKHTTEVQKRHGHGSWVPSQETGPCSLPSQPRPNWAWPTASQQASGRGPHPSSTAMTTRMR